ncbi:AEC family transporter [Amaricoccus sp.]|uniref:AEC family transporter n=1 Tax=Amaricoccus sp. TaxID=1872485 RepID=UPI002D1FA4AC|nr:AEC family transporter [Amaricoccus sp.]
MIVEILLVVIPVFLVMGAGYAATRGGVFSSSAVDGLMVFTQSFAIPCLLFRALADLDLGEVFDPRLLLSFYLGAVTAFTLGILGARKLFRHRPGEAVAIGFGALFSNSVLLGLPIMERAYGSASLGPTFAIISIHAPFCYFLGITVMEFTRADGRGLVETLRIVSRTIVRNGLMIGLALGFLFNLGDIPIPDPVRVAVDMVADSALPAALFGLGGVLTRYSIRASLAEAGMIATLSLLVHPAITYLLAHGVFALPDAFVRSAVVTASMAPGVNSYVFASMYSRGQAQAASALILATALLVLTASGWLAILGGVS